DAGTAAHAGAGTPSLGARRRRVPGRHRSARRLRVPQMDRRRGRDAGGGLMPLWPWLLAGLLGAGAPHVRAEAPELRALVADTASRSATFRQLLDRLERSD